jgi:two-component system OmpR family sensor kinase
MSIRARVTLFGLVVVAVVLAFFCTAVFGLLVSGAARDQDRALSARVDQAVATLPATLPAPQPVPPGATDPRRSDDIYVVLLAPDHTLIAATGRPPVLSADLFGRAERDGFARATVEVEPAVPVRVHIGRDLRGYVVSAQTTRRVTTARRDVSILIAVYVLLAFPACAVAIWLVAGRALRPLVRFAGLADEIGQSGDLGRRMPPAGGARSRRDALGRLTTSFNGMLDRLQASFEAQQRFTADASHELRTPLTTIRNNAGFLLAHPAAAAADQEAAVRDIVGESERMSRLVENLLVLARADAGQRLPQAPVDLSALAEQVCRRARGLYPQREISCVATPVPAVPGDADSLVQLLWILIDNAAKYTSEGGHIWVAVTQRGTAAQVHVTDDGPGLPAGEEQRIFDRFYQGDEARGGRGAGLGLAIAAWIVRAHGGSILAANNARGGASFVAEFPA